MTNIELARIVQELEVLQPNTRPPLTLEQFQAFETALECKFPSEIAQLYLEHDGTDAETDYHTMFLMPIQEAIELYNDLSQPKPTWWRVFNGLTPKTRFLWHDRNSNYAGIYVDDPLVGKITFYDHEDEDPAPIFRSITSFYQATLNNLLLPEPKSRNSIPADYPVLGDVLPADAASDLAATLNCIQEWEQSGSYESRRGWASCIVNMMPPQETGRLVSSMSYSGFDNQKIINLVAQRRFSPAIKPLTDWLSNQLSRDYHYVISAFGKIGSIEAAEALLKVLQETRHYMSYWAIQSLQNCGYEVREIENGYEYLAPNETTWRKL